jgi:predicted metal-dependent hydrolase
MDSVSLETQLPEIKIVRHARAKILRLRVEPTGIRLTVPLLCSKKQIQQFLNQSEQWLIKTWSQQQNRISGTITIPEQLYLSFHSQPFQIIQQQSIKVNSFLGIYFFQRNFLEK